MLYDPSPSTSPKTKSPAVLRNMTPSALAGRSLSVSLATLSTSGLTSPTALAQTTPAAAALSPSAVELPSAEPG